MTLSAPPIVFLLSRDPAASLPFWRDLLGAEVVEETPYLLRLRLNGVEIGLTKIPDHQPSPHPVLGLPVADILQTSAALAAQGVAFIAYPGLTEGEFAICRGGARLMNWFADPDGNLLSLIQG